MSGESPRALTFAEMSPAEKRWYRRLEFFPASLVWGTFLAAIAVSIFRPIWAIYFIIAFDLYWFLRVLYFVIFVTVSWLRHRAALRVDWEAELRKTPGWEKLVHVVFFPTYKEPVEILRETFNSLASAKYPTGRIIVILGGEERACREAFLERAEIIRKEFGQRFLKFIVTVHPDGVVGEIQGKGSNMHYMGSFARQAVDELGVPYEDVIVSAFDVDTSAHPQYFAHLAKTYLDTPDRLRCSYQPIVLYGNNIWDASPVVRVGAFGSTFWLMSELIRPDRLVTFSSHSMPFQALVDVGYWQSDIVSEDSRIFQQCMIRYDGAYRVEPLYVPVSLDAVTASTWYGSLVNLYKQQRRWAWGVEHFPYLAVNFWRKKTIPLGKKIRSLWLQTEGMYTWATAPMLIFLLGWLPLLVARLSGRQEAIFQNAPHTLEAIMNMSMVGVFASALISVALLPPRPAGKRRWVFLIMFLQWLLLPVTFVLFGSVPAVDAQTRLLLGKRLGYWVTPKSRVSNT